VRPANSEVFELIADAALIREQTGWEPRVPLREGLERTIDFVRERLSAFKPHLYTI
jgi:nucleoside-diphosphate-sugar epimerase